MARIVDFRDVTVDYGYGPVLKDISLRIREGEHTVILGANGSGKSTLIKLFSNDLYPSSKKPYIKQLFGETQWSIWELKKHLGIITNDLHSTFAAQAKRIKGLDLVISGFHSSLGVFSHMDIDTEQKQKATQAMRLLEIGYLAETPVQRMSTGQLRCCVIARAMVHAPRVLLLDEPTSGLDIKAQREFVALIRKLTKVVTIILITHHIEEIFPEITKAVLLREGRIYGDGDKALMLQNDTLSHIFDTPLRIGYSNGWYWLDREY